MKIKSNSRIILAALVVFSAFAGLGCIAASDVSPDFIGHVASDINDTIAVGHNNAPILDGNDTFTMSGRYNTGTGYHWEVSPETHGVDLVSQDNVIDHPDMCGSSATSYFTFHVNSDDYYVKLVLYTPHGDIAQEIDSDMIN